MLGKQMLAPVCKITINAQMQIKVAKSMYCPLGPGKILHANI